MLSASTRGSVNNLDLNLLRPLHALLEEGGVSRAADVLGTSQPVISRFLARLRHHLGDPLLVRSGGGMRLTERAESLRIPVRLALAQLDAIFSETALFDPKHIIKSYQIASCECYQLAFLPLLFEHLSERSPSLKLVVVAPRTDDFERLASGALDFLVGPTTRAHDSLRMRSLAVETFCCVVRPEHPRATGPLDIQSFCRQKHVVMETGSSIREGCVVEETLRAHKMEREVVLRASSFLALANVVLDSDLVATVPRRYASVAAKLGLHVIEAPSIIREQQIRLLWHSSRQDDAAHEWLRAQISALALATGPARGQLGPG